MNIKSGPVIFLLILTIILIFILGVRYGQRIEKANKIINYALNLSPTPTLQPTQIPLGFNEYLHKTCGVKFLYPSSLLLEKETTNSAIFSEKNQQLIKLSCDLKPILATNEADLLQRVNTRNGKTIRIIVGESLRPLIEKSLEFANQ